MPESPAASAHRRPGCSPAPDGTRRTARARRMPPAVAPLTPSGTSERRQLLRRKGSRRPLRPHAWRCPAKDVVKQRSLVQGLCLSSYGSAALHAAAGEKACEDDVECDSLLRGWRARRGTVGGITPPAAVGIQAKAGTLCCTAAAVSSAEAKRSEPLASTSVPRDLGQVASAAATIAACAATLLAPCVCRASIDASASAHAPAASPPAVD